MQTSDTARWRARARSALFAIIGVTLFMGWRVSQIGFDYDFESFFPQDDPETAFYLDFRDRFETDNDFLIIGIEGQPGIYDQDFLEAVDAYTASLSELPYVTQVLSPTRIEEPVRLGLSVMPRPLLRWQSPDSLVQHHLKADSARISTHPTWKGSFIAEDGSALAIQIRHSQMLSKQGCDSLALAVNALVQGWPHTTHVAGRAVAQKYYVDVMQREVMLFMAIGVCILILFLYIAFQSAWGVAIPLLVVLLSGLWTLGIMELTGKSIDVMTIVLPTIIFVVGISDVVHILSRYYEELREGQSQMGAIRAAFKEVGLATFLTTVTTAVGFLTLTTSSVVPIRDFGIYAAAGVGMAYVLAFSLLPAVMILYPAPSVSSSGRGVWWNQRLHFGFRRVLRNPRAISVVTVVLCGVAVAGALQIKIDNVLLEDLAEDDPFRREFEFFEHRFAGVRPFELAVEIPEDLSIMDREVQLEMAAITDYLEAHYGVGSIVSSDRLLAQINRLNHGDQAGFHRVPRSQREIDKIVEQTRRVGGDEAWNLVVDEATQSLRIFGKLPDLGAQHFRKKSEDFQQWHADTFPESPLQLRMTGTARLIDLNVGSLASDMTLGLSIAFLIVALIAGVMFRNVSMVVIALLPNFLPLLMIAGVMGWAGIDLKLSTSIIFTIAFGIAVDDTIHFISKLRLQLAKGRTLVYAVKRTFMSAGKAIIITSIILCGGFITLALSSFLGTFYIGVLISLTLLLAVLADLFVLPWLVFALLRWKPKKQPSVLSKILRP